jgi:hypothetical protein
VITFRVRCLEGGAGKVEWLQAGSKPDPANFVPFTANLGDWQTVKGAIPAKGPLGIVRIYLPAQRQPVEVDWVSLQGKGKARRWDFGG